jgi:hypothetical protein
MVSMEDVQDYGRSNWNRGKSFQYPVFNFQFPIKPFLSVPTQIGNAPKERLFLPKPEIF